MYRMTSFIFRLTFLKLILIKIFIVGLCAGAVISVAGANGGVLIVYDDQLQNGFSDGSEWWINRDFAYADPVHSGSYAIFFEPVIWQGLVLNSGDIDVGQYSWFEFWIHGGESGGQTLRLDFYNDDEFRARIDLNNILSQGAVPARAWERVAFAFANIGLPSGVFNNIRLYNPGDEQNQSPLFIDDVRLFQAPQIAVSPQKYYFRVQAVGTSSDFDLTISNQGSGDLHLNDILLSDTANFTLNPAAGNQSCGSDLPAIVTPGNSCQVVITFNPTLEGEFNATAAFTSNDPGNPSLIVTLTGISAADGSQLDVIYDDEIADQWLNTGWPCSDGLLSDVDISAVYPGHPGSVIEVDHCAGGWGAFVLDRRTEAWHIYWMYPNQYKSLSFRFNPGDSLESIDSLVVGLSTPHIPNPYLINYINADGLTANLWYEVNIPLSDLNIEENRFHSVVFFNNSGEPGPTYYLDDISLEWIEDNVPPVISNIQVAIGVMYDSAAIQWTTDEHTSYTFEYGITDYSTGSRTATTYEKSHEVILEDLILDTDYRFRIVAGDHQIDSETEANTALYEGTFSTPPIPTTPPVISNVNVAGESIKWNRASVCWNTDRPADSSVYYGREDYATEVTDANYAVDHCVLLRDLLPETRYQFYVASADQFGNRAESLPQEFTTIALGAADVHFVIRTGENNRPISPYIYGDNYYSYLGTGSMSAWPEGSHNLTLLRLGGNRWTAYNWENNASFAGTDWYNQNDAYVCSDASVCDTPGEAVRARVEAAHLAGAAALITVPILGYVAADKNGGGDVAQTPDYLNTRFHVSLFEKDDPYDLVPDTTDNQVYQDEFVYWVENDLADHTIFYSLDNEPDLWADTHVRIHPNPVTYEELLGKSIQYASAIKDRSPQAAVFGPVSYGWYGYTTLQDAPDGMGRNFLDVYLTSMQLAHDTTGRRLLDVLDLHWYPEATSGDGRRITTEEIDPAIAAARVQAPRSLWDPTYVENSWIANSVGGPIRLIPRMMEKIDDHYPGTRLAFTEYYYGGCDHISGAIAQAEVLGIFGREGVFAANLYRLSSDCSFVYGAVDMYRRYNGAAGCFGDISISASTDDIPGSSVYASLDSNDPQRMVMIAINKMDEWLDVEIKIHHESRLDPVDIYQLTASLPVPQHVDGITGISNDEFLYTMPPLSISTLVFRQYGLAGDQNGDGDVDGADLVSFAGYYGEGNLKADLNKDTDVNQADVGIFAGKYGRTE